MLRGLDLDVGGGRFRVLRDLDPAGEVREAAADPREDVPGNELHRRVGEVELVLPRGRQCEAPDLLRRFCHRRTLPSIGRRTGIPRSCTRNRARLLSIPQLPRRTERYDGGDGHGTRRLRELPGGRPARRRSAGCPRSCGCCSTAPAATPCCGSDPGDLRHGPLRAAPGAGGRRHPHPIGHALDARADRVRAERPRARPRQGDRRPRDVGRPLGRRRRLIGPLSATARSAISRTSSTIAKPSSSCSSVMQSGGFVMIPLKRIIVNRPPLEESLVHRLHRLVHHVVRATAAPSSRGSSRARGSRTGRCCERGPRSGASPSAPRGAGASPGRAASRSRPGRPPRARGSPRSPPRTTAGASCT